MRLRGGEFNPDMSGGGVAYRVEQRSDRHGRERRHGLRGRGLGPETYRESRTDGTVHAGTGWGSTSIGIMDSAGTVYAGTGWSKEPVGEVGRDGTACMPEQDGSKEPIGEVEAPHLPLGAPGADRLTGQSR